MSETEILPGPPPCEAHHRFARVNGVRLHYVEAKPASALNGERQAKLCLMLHGFPEFWYSWRHQIPALADAGFHVLAPDLRGYNLSNKPSGISAYRIEHLLGDVIGLITHAGAERAAIVGHDWGGVLAWQVAMRHPQVVEKLIVLNAPYPAAYWRELRSWKQRFKSWYILFFQLPVLPELVLSAGNFDWLDRMLRQQPANPQAFRPEDVRLYKQALARPGALTAALNYYRAVRHALRSAATDDVHINAPVLVLWGERDAFLSPRLTEGLNAWVPNLQVERFADVSHWIQNDVPERVNRRMIDFLRATPQTHHENREWR
jgi:pimeloyl-ACP methyl ester carboxylesterase